MEEAVQAVCRKSLDGIVGPITCDVHGNQYYPLVSGARRQVMICAHADEIGLMVHSIDDKGFVRVVPIGGVDTETLRGQRVRVNGIPGVLGCSVAPDVKREPTPPRSSVQGLWMDIGARTRKEAERVARIGDAIILDTPVTWLQHERVAARSLDNRIGVFVLLETLRRLARRKLAVDVVGVTTVQEEIGLRGAITSGYRCAPHIAINIDVNFATDHPDGNPGRWGDTGLSRGPILARGPGVNPALLAEFQAVAAQENIPVQVRAEPDAAGTDASALQLTRDGVAVMDLGIPNRYMHTAVEMVCLHDVEHSIELLTAWVLQCPPDGDYVPR